MATSPWVLFAEDEEAVTCPPNPMQDTIDILAIAITTIMLMAAGHKDVSKEHFEWTLSYLENVRDECGIIPPNIRGILNHIKLLNPTLESFNEKIFLDTSVSLDPSGAPDNTPVYAAVAESSAVAEPPAAEETLAEEAPAEEAPAEEDAAPEEDPPEEE